uniref:Uncharacterized protein n=1 Tax=Spumella elongata TaxID=89044 RepID=A0A7S3HFJ6_9STRA
MLFVARAPVQTLAGRRAQSSRIARDIWAGTPYHRPAFGFDRASPLGPDAEVGEQVPGMKAWLKQMKLEEHLGAANAWCDEMGAAVMAEVLESLDDLAKALPLEVGEVVKKRGRVAYSLLERMGEVVPQTDVVVQMNEGSTGIGNEFRGRSVLKDRKTQKVEGEVAS